MALLDHRCCYRRGDHVAVHAALESGEVRATQQLSGEAVIHVDETSLRGDKKNDWIHVHSGGITLKKSHRKRGKIAQSDAHNLLERLQKQEAFVRLFAQDPVVPFTNNRGECDLRMGKVKQKV